MKKIEICVTSNEWNDEREERKWRSQWKAEEMKNDKEAEEEWRWWKMEIWLLYSENYERRKPININDNDSNEVKVDNNGWAE